MAVPVETIVGLTTTAMCAVLAPMVYFADPGRWSNRFLAILLALEGIADGLAGIGNLPGVAPDDAAGFNGVFRTAVLAMPFAYLALLGTLETPLGRPFRGGAARAALAVGAAVAVVSGFVFRSAFAFDDGIPVAVRATYAALVASCLFGLACAFDARRRTPVGSPARRRSTTYLAAFGARDVAFAVFGLGVLLDVQGVDPSPLVGRILGGAPFYGNILFVPLLAYGILRYRLLDVDLRLKWTIGRGALVGIFLAVFFVASQLAENLLDERFGVVGGAVVAGLLLFALAPIQRAAERVADVAMPKVRPTPEYLAERRLEVYRAAVESAQEEGGIDAKERAILDRLQAKLGLSRQDATRVEAAVLTA